MEPGAGGEAFGKDYSIHLWRGVGPLSEKDLADKEHPEGPQKVVSRPSRRPLARLPQRGRFVLGPCNPFLGTAPQRRPESGLGPGLPPGVSAGRGVLASTAQPPHPLLESWGSPRGPCGHPRGGWRGEVRNEGLLPFRKWRSLATTSGRLDFLSSGKRRHVGGEGAAPGARVPRPSPYNLLSGQVSGQRQNSP